MSKSEWHQPLIAVDVVTFSYNSANKTLNYILGARQFEPYQGQNALPGVLLDKESAENAAYRALETKTGIQKRNVIYLKDIGVTDNPERDERGPSLSVIYVAVVTDDSFNSNIASSHPLIENINPHLPFDHSAILTRAVNYIQNSILVDHKLTQSLTGEVFKTSDIFNILNDISVFLEEAEKPDASNLSRKLKTMGWFTKTNDPHPKGRGRPSSVWQYI